ncbi:MAG: hypothetical protein CMJ75_20990 [Planctomycetaceae bacterium]|nr:hypothetical protein [Planctomycetaceae bacterium]
MSTQATHTIRLRGPWKLQALARTVLLADGTTEHGPGILPPSCTVQVPADWSASLGADFCGQALYSRRFGCPTGLQPGDQVSLVVEKVDALAQVAINNSSLGTMRITDGTRSWPIKHLLQPRNLLELIIEQPSLTKTSAPLPRPGREAKAGGLIGEVKLVILPG